MKKHMLKYKKVAKVVILILLSMVYTNSYGDDGVSCVKILKNLGNFIIKIERRFSDFFDYNNSTPFSNYINAFEELFTELETHAAVRSVNGALTHEVLIIIDYSRQQFHPALNIIKKYNGKGKEHAPSFVTELKRVFDLDTAFSTIKSKLQALHAKAVHQNNTQLVTTLEQLIIFIDKKMNDWTKKSHVTLFGGLCHRMTCR